MLLQNSQRSVDAVDLETLAKSAIYTMSAACNASMPRRKVGHRMRKPVFWWNLEISKLRRKRSAARVFDAK